MIFRVYAICDELQAAKQPNHHAEFVKYCRKTEWRGHTWMRFLHEIWDHSDRIDAMRMIKNDMQWHTMTRITLCLFFFRPYEEQHALLDEARKYQILKGQKNLRWRWEEWALWSTACSKTLEFESIACAPQRNQQIKRFIIQVKYLHSNVLLGGKAYESFLKPRFTNFSPEKITRSWTTTSLIMPEWSP